ncbi:hypothetical protein CEE45_06480 [Candidatus Heimdallarchaeota archaeon B3_Heim]|nr:MAG: hypothetical protein CEE45_06480 [Candidatus Heimdallarchaeota archaeon B3_Heim]
MATTFFNPTKDTWMTSFKENKPIVFLFQDKLCPACYSFEQTVLSDPEVQEYLFSNFLPVHLDINRFPDLYERFAGNDFLVHTIQAINGNLLGSCNNLSVSHFLKNLYQYKQISQQIQDPFQDVLTLQDFSPLIQEEAKRFHEKIDLISEITLSTLLGAYDSMYGGWAVQKHKIYPSSALDFLLLFHQRSQDEELLKIIIQTLRATYRGLFDKQNGGFFESANRDWKTVLSFKKSLENNVSAARTLFHSYQLTLDPYYLDKIRETLVFCLNDLWNKKQGLFNYGLLAHPLYDLTNELFLSRGNCEIISLLYEVEGIIDLPTHKKELDKIKSSVLKRLRKSETPYGIPHELSSGKRHPYKQFLLQDQAAYLNLFIQLYSFTGRAIYRKRAISFVNLIIEHYFDLKNNLFKDRVSIPETDFGPLMKNLFPIRDNAFMVNNLVTLSHLTEKPTHRPYRELATNCVTSYYSNFGISREAPFPPEFVIANQRLIESAIELVIIGSIKDKKTQQLMIEMKKIYDPFSIIELFDPNKDKQMMELKFKDYNFHNPPLAFIKIDSTISPPAYYPKEISLMLQRLLEAFRSDV